jgi:hypothetical protein
MGIDRRVKQERRTPHVHADTGCVVEKAVDHIMRASSSEGSVGSAKGTYVAAPSVYAAFRRYVDEAAFALGDGGWERAVAGSGGRHVLKMAPYSIRCSFCLLKDRYVVRRARSIP